MEQYSTIKSIIIEEISKYTNEFYLNTGIAFQPPEVLIQYGKTVRSGNNLAEIAKRCVQNKILLNTISALSSSYDLDEFYTIFEHTSIKLQNNFYDDNKIANKLFPIMIYIYYLNNTTLLYMLEWCSKYNFSVALSNKKKL